MSRCSLSDIPSCSLIQGNIEAWVTVKRDDASQPQMPGMMKNANGEIFIRRMEGRVSIWWTDTCSHNEGRRLTVGHVSVNGSGRWAHVIPRPGRGACVSLAGFDHMGEPETGGIGRIVLRIYEAIAVPPGGRPITGVSGITVYTEDGLIQPRSDRPQVAKFSWLYQHVPRASPTLAQSSRKRTPARSSPEPIVQVSGSQASGSQARQSGIKEAKDVAAAQYQSPRPSIPKMPSNAAPVEPPMSKQEGKKKVPAREPTPEDMADVASPPCFKLARSSKRIRSTGEREGQSTPTTPKKLTMSKEEDKKRAFMQETTLEDMNNVAPCPDSVRSLKRTRSAIEREEQWANFLILPEDSSPASSPQKPQKRAKTSDDEWLDLESFYDRNRPMSRAEVDALFESHLEKPAEPGTWNGGSLWKMMPCCDRSQR